MDQCIIPAVWCAAAEAAEFYAETFREGSVVEWAPGLAATVSIHGFRLSLIDGGNQYAPNPSISCILNFDPLLFGGEKQAEPTLMSSTSGSALAASS
ncbi:3-demethylubiquinone-9 3-methyltransferase domain protein [Actinomyces sp. oral taxon 848 str. F0332]|nr:3-demethylubiquinone-9 3-methyltransferase domain protein [Actinomyces sp. oral taxon 848 str. F0332]